MDETDGTDGQQKEIPVEGDYLEKYFAEATYPPPEQEAP
jgi:hypothetical protein